MITIVVENKYVCITLYYIGTVIFVKSQLIWIFSMWTKLYIGLFLLVLYQLMYNRFYFLHSDVKQEKL